MRFLILIIVALSFYSCRQERKEFKELNDDISYKLLSFDENEKYFQKDNLIRASIQLFDGNNIIYNKYQTIPFNAEQTPFKELITILNEGDSIHFKVKTDFLKANHFNLNFEQTKPILEGYLKIYEFLTIDKIRQFKAQNDPEFLEQKILNVYIKSLAGIKNKNGVYVQTIQKGEGEEVMLGKTLTLKFRASFIDGVEFDNTHFQDFFEYTYGTPNQVIEGLDVALLGMKNKEKAKIIIPSQLAFGEDGSSTGIVPPFTSLVYDIEIIDIK